MGPSIAIIGAGPAGLTLARLLQVANVSITITIFELDASPTARTYQGGTLDLHPETGLAALRRAGLWDEAVTYLRYEGEEMVIADKNGTQLLHITEAPKIGGYDERPEIDREKLKEILLASVKGECVRWGKKLKRVDAGKGILEFEDGETAGPFDLVIGADGAYSKVRNVLTEVRPAYSGICGFEGHIYEPKKDHPKTDAFVGRGSYFASSDGKSLMAQRMGDDSIKCGMWLKREETYPAALTGKGPINEDSLKEKLLAEFDDWVPDMKEWIKTSTRFRPWALYELPVGHTWEHREGYTLIGDAAHLCTPFAGQGVNAAMKDALELCDLIVASQKGEVSLDEAVEKYEKGMFPRASRVQQDTMRNKIAMFRHDSPIGFMIAMVGVVGEETGWNFDKGFLAWVPVRKLAYSWFWLLTGFGSLKRRLVTG